MDTQGKSVPAAGTACAKACVGHVCDKFKAPLGGRRGRGSGNKEGWLSRRPENSRGWWAFLRKRWEPLEMVREEEGQHYTLFYSEGRAGK